jgi:hypothetical protein
MHHPDADEPTGAPRIGARQADGEGERAPRQVPEAPMIAPQADRRGDLVETDAMGARPSRRRIPGLRTRLLRRVGERRARLIQVALLLAHGEQDVDGAPVTIETLHCTAVDYEAAVHVASHYTGKDRVEWPYTP